MQMLNKWIMLILLLSQLSLFADNASPRFKGINEKVITGQNIREYTISTNGQYLLVVRKQSQALELLDASDFTLIKAIPTKGIANENNEIDFVFNAGSRESFIVGMGGSNLLWEILYEENPLPVYNGVMHDYQLGEGLARDQSHFPIRIIKPAGKTSIPISSYYFYSVEGMIFIARDRTIEVIQLDARQSVGTIILDKIPNLTFSRVNTINDTPHLLVPFLNKSGVTSINMNSWTTTEAVYSFPFN